MRYEIDHRPVYSSLRVALEKGEQFRAQPGAMLSMSASIELRTQTSGKGLLGTLKAAVGGESIFASIYEAIHGPGELILAPDTPGDILEMHLSGESILTQSGAYLAGDPSLTLSA
ncbi:MAG: AIM24 family protein, partial [Candidatus Kapaibacteriota bacterium]